MPLVLDLLRHGEALPASESGDEARPLSPRGERDLERLGRHLATLGWRPDRAFASPLARARDTARIVLAHAASEVHVVAWEALRPDGEPAELVASLVVEGVTSGHILLVGHQPLLGDLTRWLTGAAAPAWGPGDLVRLEFAEAPATGAGRFTWRLRPRDCG